MDFYDNEIDWDWDINDLEEMGNREAWEDAQAEKWEEIEGEIEDGDWESDEDSED